MKLSIWGFLAALLLVVFGCTEQSAVSNEQRLVVPEPVMHVVFDKALKELTATLDPQQFPVPPTTTKADLNLACGGDWFLWWDEDSEGNPDLSTVELGCIDDDG